MILDSSLMILDSYTQLFQLHFSILGEKKLSAPIPASLKRQVKRTRHGKKYFDSRSCCIDFSLSGPTVVFGVFGVLGELLVGVRLRSEARDRNGDDIADRTPARRTDSPVKNIYTSIFSIYLSTMDRKYVYGLVGHVCTSNL